MWSLCILLGNPDSIIYLYFVPVVANDDASLVKNIGKSFRLSAVEVE
jgi:hypothetical protein